MFPLPFNIPFRKKDGTLSTLGDELNNGGGGGGSYTLPTASADVKGGVKIGEGLTMEGEVLKNNNPTPATPYTLPTASDEVLGGVKVGSGLSINESGVLSASGGGGGGTSVTHIDRLSSSGTLTNGTWDYTFTKRGFLLVRFDGYADATQAIQPRMYLNNSNDLFRTTYTEYPNIAKGSSVFITLPVNAGDKFSIAYGTNLRNFSAQFLDLDYVSPT